MYAHEKEDTPEQCPKKIIYARSSCGKKKTTSVNLLSNNRVIFNAVWKEEADIKSTTPIHWVFWQPRGCRSTGSRNRVQSLIMGGFLSSASMGKKKKKKSESWGSPSIFHDQWVFLHWHLRLHFGALDDSIIKSSRAVVCLPASCQHSNNPLHSEWALTHYSLLSLFFLAVKDVNYSRLFILRLSIRWLLTHDRPDLWEMLLITGCEKQ